MGVDTQAWDGSFRSPAFYRHFDLRSLATIGAGVTMQPFVGLRRWPSAGIVQARCRMFSSTVSAVFHLVGKVFTFCVTRQKQ